MNGIIKVYKDDKGYGFILGEDEKQYFFHISNVKSTEIPEVGLGVKFKPDKNDKGLLASEIEIKNKLTKKFIKLGDERIKLSNIKNYGLASGSVYFQKVYEFVVENKIFDIRDYQATNKWHEIPYIRYYDISNGSKDYMHIISAKKGDLIGVFIPSKRKLFDTSYKTAKADGIYDLNKIEDMDISFNANATKSDVKKASEDYLFITFYQGDNYQVYKSKASFDIYEKLSELDEILT